MIESFPDQGSIRFQKVRDAGGVLNATFALMRRNARELFIGFLALVVPFALIAGIGQALYIRQVGGLLSPDAMFGQDFERLTDLFPPSYFVSIIAGLIGTAVAQAAAAGYVRLYREGAAGEITPGLLWEESKGLILPTFGLGILYFLFILISAVVNIIPCLGTIAWFAFVIWTLPYYGVAWSSRMVESDSIGEAASRAMVLVKGSWGFAFGTYLLVGFITFIVIIALMIPMQAALSVAMTGGADSSGALTILGLLAVPQQFLNYAAYLLPALAGFFVHGRLAAELDGTHLDAELDLLETGLDAAPSSTWVSEPPTAPDETLDAPLGDPDPSASDDTGDDAPEAGTGGFRGGGFS